MILPDDLMMLYEMGVPPDDAATLWDFTTDQLTELGQRFRDLNLKNQALETAVADLNLRNEQLLFSNDNMFKSMMMVGSFLEHEEQERRKREDDKG